MDSEAGCAIFAVFGAVLLVIVLFIRSCVLCHERDQLRAALIQHGLGEYYSDEPGRAPDKFRLVDLPEDGVTR